MTGEAFGLPLAGGSGGGGGSAFRGARATRTASAQSVPTGTLTIISLNGETFDPYTLHDTATNNSRIVLDQIGYWSVQASLLLTEPGSPSGLRQVYIVRNGTYLYDHVIRAGPAGNTMGPAISDVIQATAVTDYVEMAAWHNQGSALSCAIGTSLTAHFLGA